MVATRDLPNEVHFKEFQNDPQTGHHYTATCGETALASAMVCATAKIENTADAINLMTSMTREMMALGWASSPNGSTTVAHLKEEAEKRGFTVNTANFKDPGGTEKSLYQSFDLGMNLNWLHAVLLEFAGIEPIVLEVSKAYNLRSLNGGQDEAGVQYHFICVVGIHPDGYVCMDGDNSAISTHLVVYPWSVIEAAGVCGVLVLEMQEAQPVALDISKTNGYFVASGNDWKCVKNGILVQDSVLDFYRNMAGGLNGLTSLGLPLADKFYVGAVGIQVFERGVVVYDPDRKFDNPPGASGPCYLGHIDELRVVGILTPALQAQLAQAQSDLKAAQGQVKDLQGQLDAANNKPPVKADDPLGDAVRALLAEAKKEGVL